MTNTGLITLRFPTSDCLPLVIGAPSSDAATISIFSGSVKIYIKIMRLLAGASAPKTSYSWTSHATFAAHYMRHLSSFLILSTSNTILLSLLVPCSKWQIKSTHLSTYLSIYLSVYLSIYLSTCLSVYLLWTIME